MQNQLSPAPFYTSGHAPPLSQMLSAQVTRLALTLASTARVTPYADVEDELSKLDGDELRFDDTKPCAPGTLGEACVRFWRKNGLKPFAMKPSSSLDPGRKLLARRLLLHDVCHVLLNFKAGWPGQLGVFSFIAGQRYCPEFEWSARRLGHIYTTAAPWLRDELAMAEAEARRLAFVAPRLLTMPIEREWDASLVWLRDRLNIRKVRTLQRPEFMETHHAAARPENTR